MMDEEPEHLAEARADKRKRFVIPPSAWLVLQASANVAWLIGIASGGYLIVRWLFG